MKGMVHSYPWENNNNKDLFESDMKLTPTQRLLALTGRDISLANRKIGRGSIADRSWIWLPEKLVPYTLSDDIVANPAATWAITQGLRDWETKTCLQFIQRTDEKDYLHFYKEDGCWSYIGKVGGKQEVSIGEGCESVGTAVHEIGHAMGFYHEQSRTDRDDYLEIKWENINPNETYNFNKYNRSYIDSFDTPYDYLSVMQYSRYSFGNGTVTMEPKLPGIFQMGQDVGLSEIDAFQASQLYKCQGRTTRHNKIDKPHVLKGHQGCNFEHGLCHFSNNKDDDFDWVQKVGPSPSGNTGPDADHTTGRMGVYMYIEASLPRQQNDTARISSRVFRPTRVTCLSFYYNMHAANSSHMGTFNVLLKEFGIDQPRVLITKSGDQGLGWKYGKVQFYSNRIHQVIFEGIRGSDYQGDIAIDDISFNEGRCPVNDPTEKLPCVDEYCEDIDDREGEFCQSWTEAGYCKQYHKLMRTYCPQSCGLCKS